MHGQCDTCRIHALHKTNTLIFRLYTIWWLPQEPNHAPYPLLPIAVLQVIDITMVPVNTDAQQRPWEEAILSHNHKVSKKPSKSLDHPCKQVDLKDFSVIVSFHRSEMME